MRRLTTTETTVIFCNFFIERGWGDIFNANKFVSFSLPVLTKVSLVIFFYARGSGVMQFYFLITNACFNLLFQLSVLKIIFDNTSYSIKYTFSYISRLKNAILGEKKLI